MRLYGPHDLWIYCTACLLWLATGSAAYAGAWTLPENEQQLILNLSHYRTHDYVTPSGTKIKQPTYSKTQLNPYYEYGLQDDITLGASLFADYLTQGNQDNLGIAEAEIFARKQLIQGEDWVISFQSLIKTPRLVDSNDTPQLGSNQWDMEGRVLYGGNFSLLGRLHYLDTSLAYRHRTGTPADQLRADATLGFTLSQHWSILGQVTHTEGLGSLTSSGGRIANAEEYDLTKLQLSAVYKIDEQRALQAGAFTHLRARNTGGGEGAIAALWWGW